MTRTACEISCRDGPGARLRSFWVLRLLLRLFLLLVLLLLLMLLVLLLLLLLLPPLLALKKGLAVYRSALKKGAGRAPLCGLTIFAYVTLSTVLHMCPLKDIACPAARAAGWIGGRGG